jgi:drug/metabolite transporter (DMT)-like permease
MRLPLPSPREHDGFDPPEIAAGGGDEAIVRYLATERAAAARRIGRVGLAALVLGAIGLVPLVDWWSHGGSAPPVALATPLLLAVGVLLTAYGAVARARSIRYSTASQSTPRA